MARERRAQEDLECQVLDAETSVVCRRLDVEKQGEEGMQSRR
jgi:hypothetical protein